MQGDWGTTIGERLRWAINQRPRDGRRRGVRKFQSDIANRSSQLVKDGHRAIPGVTMPSIQGYLQDHAKPSFYFLEAAADLCRVDEAWLISGKGHPTDEHAEAARTAAATVSAQLEIGDLFSVTGSGPSLDMLHRGVFETLGRPLPDAPPPWLAGLIEVWLQLTEGSETDADFETVVVETLMGPLERMGVDPVEMYGAGNFDSYVFAMTPVMLMLAAERTRQNLDAEEVD